MKKYDWICISGIIIFFTPFFLFPSLFDSYRHLNNSYPYLMAFVKFSILAPFGEMLGLRIRKGLYYEKGFGLLPRMIVWGFLGISLKMAFDIFSVGAPNMLRHMGMNIPGDILLQKLSALKVFVAFSIGASLNIFYAPILMVSHKILDEHIAETNGSLKKFFSKIRFGEHLIHLNWHTQWHFVLKKTIPFFWIPAQTVNFLLPEEFRVLFAALLSIVLGILLAIAAVMSKNKQ